jgi:hypothetical protein
LLQHNSSINYLVKNDGFSKQVVYVIYTQLYYELISNNTNNTTTITTITNTSLLYLVYYR